MVMIWMLGVYESTVKTAKRRRVWMRFMKIISFLHSDFFFVVEIFGIKIRGN